MTDPHNDPPWKRPHAENGRCFIGKKHNNKFSDGLILKLLCKARIVSKTEPRTFSMILGSGSSASYFGVWPDAATKLQGPYSFTVFWCSQSHCRLSTSTLNIPRYTEISPLSTRPDRVNFLSVHRSLVTGIESPSRDTRTTRYLLRCLLFSFLGQVISHASLLHRNRSLRSRWRIVQWNYRVSYLHPT